MRRFIAAVMLFAIPSAWAIEGMGNPWETIDEALCVALKAESIEGAVIQSAERVGSTPAHCRVVAMIDGARVEVRLPAKRDAAAASHDNATAQRLLRALADRYYRP